MNQKIKTLIFCLVFGLSGLLIPVVYTFFSESSVLSIKTIQLKTGNRAKPEELQLYLREFIGKPLYGVDLRQVVIVAQRHPWVASAVVLRQPPGTLEVDIVEREPVALMKQNKLLVLDTQGVAFKTAENETELSLPLVHQIGAVAILIAHVQAKHPGGAIIEIKPHGVHQHSVLFSNGLEAIVGEKNILSQWQKLAHILKSLGEKQHHLAFVYLDDSSKMNRVAVRFKKG